MAQRTDWARLMTVPGLAEAEMWRGLLAEEGIVALIQPNDASPYLGPQSFCHLLVPAAEAERAADLTRAWSAEAPADEAATAAD